MSLTTKKDPSMRVAANDPHLVSLGGGRLSTAVTIHNIPIGDTTIGSSPACNISLNGSGVRATHCTIYRSEENEVTIVPETDARVLIDGAKIQEDTNLTQGAMITIGNSNYLRFNNPAEAQMIRSVMGSNERISMPQIDFTQMQQCNSIKSNLSLSSSSYHNDSNGSNGVGGGVGGGNNILEIIDIDTFYESKINPLSNNVVGEIIKPIDINGLQCPKVFKADLVTVNLPAKDVLGQKYANFAKNFAENHRNEKNMQNTLRNNQMMNSSVTSLSPNLSTTPTSRSVANAKSNYLQNSNGSCGSNEYLAKVNNTSFLANDRYPKPGSYGGLQIFPMNGVNNDINGQTQQQQQQDLLSENERLEDMLKICTEYADRQQQQQQQNQQSQPTQQNSINSSPIVQNRIKTNGSLPREKKSPFYAADGNTNVGNHQQQQQHQRSTINTNSTTTTTTTTTTMNSSGYENVSLLTENRAEKITEQQQLNNSNSTNNNNNNNNNNHHHNTNNSGNNIMTTITTSTNNQRTNGYENVVVGKYVPQSPRTKIRTTCMSPKKEHNFNGSPFSSNNNNNNNAIAKTITSTNSHTNTLAKHQEYAQLIKTFEQKLQLEMQAIEESSRYKPPVPPLKPNNNNTTKSATNTPIKRLNKNINNLSLNIQKQQQESRSLQNSPKPCKKPAPAPRSVLLQQEKIPHKNTTTTYSSDSLDIDIERLKETRKTLLRDQQSLKRDINALQQHEGEALHELKMEKALVLAEVTNLTETLADYDQRLHELKTKIHRLEAQRNATRVMEETQQAKLKQSIEIKQEQVQKLKELLLQKPNNECLKEELHNVSDSLENDRKIFEDLEFQYLEEESEWHAYREELHLEETDLSKQLTEKRQQLQQLRNEEDKSQCTASTDTQQLQRNMHDLLKELQNCENNLHATESKMIDVSDNCNAEGDHEHENEGEEKNSVIQIAGNILNGGGMMSQSLFGSAEILCAKRIGNEIMSKSVNENMFYNNSIEAPMGNATSTPKHATMKIISIEQHNDNDENWSPSERMKFNLSLGSDDFEVNPLEKRVPSQDDIDRICKVTSDAPISTKGASTKIFDSIKEIERNRQLLLAQQGHHVIEHERQKMFDLKKRCHDEARAQYLSQSSVNSDHAGNAQQEQQQQNMQQQTHSHRGSFENAEELQKLNAKSAEVSFVSGKIQLSDSIDSKNISPTNKACTATTTTTTTAPTLTNNDTQRHSQPEFQADEQRANAHLLLPPHVHNNPRPLSATNSDLSCDILQTDNNNQLSYSQNCAANKSSLELNALALRQAAVLQRFSNERALRHKEQEDEAELEAERKRSSLNSTETNGSGGGGNVNGGSSSASGSSGSSAAYVERKRAVLPKHQRPLTRYLPIFSPDLNLRHHIETAGHQIALCPHVFIDAFSCRGYLHKLGATFHTWARRWFVLDRQRSAFIYYADKSERKPRGGAYFSTIDEVYLDHLNASKSGRPHCTFVVKTKKRSYHLQAASDAAARIWIDAIITGAQGNMDY